METGSCMRELAVSLHKRMLGRSLHMSICRAFLAMDTAEFLAHGYKSGAALPAIKVVNSQKVVQIYPTPTVQSHRHPLLMEISESLAQVFTPSTVQCSAILTSSCPLKASPLGHVRKIVYSPALQHTRTRSKQSSISLLWSATGLLSFSSIYQSFPFASDNNLFGCT